MKILGFFNNKGGVGKTTLAYHVSHMFANLGLKVVAFDLDPQANLTSLFLPEERLEELWEPEDGGQTILGCIHPIRQGIGDIVSKKPLEVAEGLWLLPGHLGLSLFEDKLATSWSEGFKPDPSALRATTAFYRIMDETMNSVNADIGLVDVGPNLGAINRSALLAADYLLFPLAPDLFSLQGLRNLGPTVQSWRKQWGRMKEAAREIKDIPLPDGRMKPVGYVVFQHEVRLDRPVKAFGRWLARIPQVYAENISIQTPTNISAKDDPNCLASLRNYRSLMPMSHEARKPMFDLKAVDGAIGSHARLVEVCYEDFKSLTTRISAKINLRLK